MPSSVKVYLSFLYHGLDHHPAINMVNVGALLVAQALSGHCLIITGVGLLFHLDDSAVNVP